MVLVRVDFAPAAVLGRVHSEGYSCSEEAQGKNAMSRGGAKAPVLAVNGEDCNRKFCCSGIVTRGKRR